VQMASSILVDAEVFAAVDQTLSLGSWDDETRTECITGHVAKKAEDCTVPSRCKMELYHDLAMQMVAPLTPQLRRAICQ
jgi:hypothetical protein